MDLPTAWNHDDKSSYLSVDESGLRVNYGLGLMAGAVRANYPISPQCKLFYFEVDIINEGENKQIGIGFCDKVVSLNGMPGWYNNSWGYHGDDGKLFCCSGSGIAFRNLKGTLYPCVGLRSQGGSIEVNFGSRKFKFAGTYAYRCW
ncbi:SPRY-domain-containing protein [Gigaspora margarita]|uniref:SPRY-domain-containing protein n=1 Tax=Gigaspora margarita TaxID=4874 RepID=A0A8H3XBI1_GIGMA|nr:SPRY-domain-containing protein [Gigaspora margarita]